MTKIIGVILVHSCTSVADGVYRLLDGLFHCGVSGCEFPMVWLGAVGEVELYGGAGEAS